MIFAIHGIFAYFDLLDTDANSARYMLSALVQSQAAIVAIVVSLTLIAVQLTSSAYSPRVIRIFRDNHDMWILLILYGISIFYGLFALKIIRGVSDSSQIVFLNPSLEAYITVVYALGISSFAILFLYLWNIMALLDPANIINRLSKYISRDKLLKYLESVKTEEETRTSRLEDPIQPIMDIVHGSIMKYDIATTRVGLKAVTERVIEIIDSDGEKEISERFCNHLERVGRLAISRDEEESVVVVIKNLENFAKAAVEKKVGIATAQAAESIRMVGITAAGNKLEDATRQAAFSLGYIGIWAAGEEGFAGGRHQAAGVTYQATLSLGKVGRAAVENELKSVIQQTVKPLVAIGISTVEKGFSSATGQAARSLAEWTTFSEEVVETSIQDYESKLKEEYREYFQKFMKIYEQKFEELRAENKNSE